MTVKDYKALCKSGSFMDYDGFGDQLTETGALLESTHPSTAKGGPAMKTLAREVLGWALLICGAYVITLALFWRS